VFAAIGHDKDEQASAVSALQRLCVGPQATNGGITQQIVGNLPQAATLTNHFTNKLIGRGGIGEDRLARTVVDKVLHYPHFMELNGTIRTLVE
jgi:hypothetical protein